MFNLFRRDTPRHKEQAELIATLRRRLEHTEAALIKAQGELSGTRSTLTVTYADLQWAKAQLYRYRAVCGRAVYLLQNELATSCPAPEVGGVSQYIKLSRESATKLLSRMRHALAGEDDAD